MRTLTVLILLFAFYSTTCFQSHDLILGNARTGDRVLFMGNEKKYGFPFVTRTTDFVFPEQGVSNYARITSINIKDKFTNGKGGTATIVDGGLGQTFVKIKFTSQRGHGYDFDVNIFGQ
nr:venom peptide [Acharia stimulea]